MWYIRDKNYNIVERKLVQLPDKYRGALRDEDFGDGVVFYRNIDTNLIEYVAYQY